MIEPPQNKRKTRQFIHNSAVHKRLEMNYACGDVKKCGKNNQHSVYFFLRKQQSSVLSRSALVVVIGGNVLLIDASLPNFNNQP